MVTVLLCDHSSDFLPMCRSCWTAYLHLTACMILGSTSIITSMQSSMSIYKKEIYSNEEIIEKEKKRLVYMCLMLRIYIHSKYVKEISNEEFIKREKRLVYMCLMLRIYIHSKFKIYEDKNREKERTGMCFDVVCVNPKSQFNPFFPSSAFPLGCFPLGSSLISVVDLFLDLLLGSLLDLLLGLLLGLLVGLLLGCFPLNFPSFVSTIRSSTGIGINNELN